MTKMSTILAIKNNYQFAYTNLLENYPSVFKKFLNNDHLFELLNNLNKDTLDNMYEIILNTRRGK